MNIYLIYRVIIWLIFQECVWVFSCGPSGVYSISNTLQNNHTESVLRCANIKLIKFGAYRGDANVNWNMRHILYVKIMWFVDYYLSNIICII